MGFLTRWIASGIPDGAARDAALETHLTAMTDKCEKTKDNWDQPTRTDKYWLKDKAKMAYMDSETSGARLHPGRKPNW